jgi:superfamily II DNA or RNA helicase
VTVEQSTGAAAPAPGHFDGAAYGRPFRRYQSLAFDAFEKSRAEGRARCYVVMPPGAGKTVVGLEIARRLGRPTIVLGPNTAIQAQWISQWGDFHPPKPAGATTSLEANLNVLTYQALCTLDDDAAGLDELAGGSGAPGAADHEDDDEETEGAEAPAAAPANAAAPAKANARDRADAAAERARRRRLIVRGGDRDALLGLLHENGRALFERIRAAGEVTLILDECHHLLEMWGHLVQALVDTLGDHVFLVGLTATPPADMDTREAELYAALFGHADFAVPTPAVVKEGELAPYQELAYLTEPLAAERAWIAAQQARFEELIVRLEDPTFASRPFLDWLHARVVERATAGGAQVRWERFEHDEPDLSAAALRLFLARNLALPEGARVGERHRRPPTADDWALLIGDYCQGFLRHSADPHDEAAWEEIRRALPAVGYVLTRGGVRSYVSPVDRVLALSAAKGVAAQTILDLESQALGPALRALILCDYERAGVTLLAELRDVLDPQAGSAALILQLLLADAATRVLDPVLLTGRTVACSRATALAFAEWCAGGGPELPADLPPDLVTALAGLPLAVAPAAAGAPAAGQPGWEDVVVIAPEHGWWEPRHYVPLVTRFLEAGHSRCLVGTRGLLGEGWDARSVNVLVDLTGAATSTSVHQMRGRSLRLDARLPHKVANNWDVVCVAPEHPKGFADYSRFVRKHHAYFALTATGEIECGVSHVDPVLSPFGPPPATDIPALNARTLDRVGRREQAYALWGIGQPYRNTETDTVRVRFARAVGVPERSVLRHDPAAAGRVSAGLRVAGGGALLAVAGTVAGLDPALAVGSGAAIVAAGGSLAGLTAATRLRRLVPSDALEDLAAAIVTALAATGGVNPQLGAGNVRIVAQPDGYYRCYLEGASREDSTAFATALDELLAPFDAPRYIIGRPLDRPPASGLGALRLVARRAVGIRGPLVYHAVPEFLAARKERVATFENAWHQFVGPGRALFNRDPRAIGLIELHRGENPMASETQLRTLWT